MTSDTPETDYTPGDAPLHVGTDVDYFGSRTEMHGRYTITDRNTIPKGSDWEEMCPDGVTYDLWPVGVPVKFGNRDKAIYKVRRLNLRVIPPKEIMPHLSRSSWGEPRTVLIDNLYEDRHTDVLYWSDPDANEEHDNELQVELNEARIRDLHAQLSKIVAEFDAADRKKGK